MDMSLGIITIISGLISLCGIIYLYTEVIRLQEYIKHNKIREYNEDCNLERIKYESRNNNNNY